MIKKTIKYQGFDGVEIVEDFFFHMSSAELTEKELAYPGGFAAHLKEIVKADDRPAIIAAFKDLVLSSVGVKLDDNKTFYKKGVAEKFEATDAYSVLFMELVSDAGKSADFFNGVMPEDLMKKVQVAMGNSTRPMAAEPTQRKFPDDYSETEILEMPKQEFDQLMKALPGNNIPRPLLMLALRRTDK